MLYCISFVGFAYLLSKSQDNFFIKMELAVAGIGMFIAMLASLLISSLNLPCTVTSCSLLMLWLAWLWLLCCSIIVPLAVAMRDARFSYTRCFKMPKSATPRSTVASPDSKFSRETELFKFRESQCHTTLRAATVRRLSGDQLDRMRQVPLASFLMYPPGREAFRKWTVREFSVENLLFVEAVKRVNESGQATQADFEALYDQYVIPAAPYQVNLPSQSVHRVKGAMATKDLSQLRLSFTEAADHIMKLMQRDAYKRFQGTHEWAQHVVVFDTEATKPPISRASTVTHISDDERTETGMSSEDDGPFDKSSSHDKSSAAALAPAREEQHATKGEQLV